MDLLPVQEDIVEFVIRPFAPKGSSTPCTPWQRRKDRSVQADGPIQ